MDAAWQLPDNSYDSKTNIVVFYSLIDVAGRIQYLKIQKFCGFVHHHIPSGKPNAQITYSKVLRIKISYRWGIQYLQIQLFCNFFVAIIVIPIMSCLVIICLIFVTISCVWNRFNLRVDTLPGNRCKVHMYHPGLPHLIVMFSVSNLDKCNY